MVTPFHDLTVENVDRLDNILHTAASFFVLCVGFSKEQASAFTKAYRREFSANWLSLQHNTCHVESTVIAYVDKSLFDAVLGELQYIPAVIMLNEDVTYTKITKRYVRKTHTPLIRVTSEPKAVVELCRDDYYNNVCATITATDLSNSEVVCPTLDYALLVSLRMNKDIIQRAKDVSGSATTAIPLEALDLDAESAVDAVQENPPKGHTYGLSKLKSLCTKGNATIAVARAAILLFLLCASVAL
jgi:hypothetical protein